MIAALLMADAIVTIANCSIGIQCFNECQSPDMNAEHPNNKKYIVGNLITSIIVLLISFVLMYFAFTMPSTSFQKFKEFIMDEYKK
jgi:heme/copper-type cytochrome/quinol oxidase subunit 2